MTFAASVWVHSAGSNPFPVLAVLRELLGAGNVLDVHKRLQSGSVEVGAWDSLQAVRVARQLSELGAVVTVETGAVLSRYLPAPTSEPPESGSGVE